MGGEKFKQNGIYYGDTLEETIEIGSEIRILRGENRGRKAILIDIDYLSEMGSYRDRHTVKMVKSGEEFDCVREFYERW